MKNNRKYTINTSKSEFNTKLQDITERLDTLDLDYCEESNQLR